MWRYLTIALGALVGAAGCGPTSVADRESFGRFEGEVVALWDADGRRMQLREPFSYIDSTDRRWTAPAGTVVDGASIPAAFWSLIGGPFSGKYRNASVVHDIGCDEMLASWEDVHWMFYEACRCAGVDEFQAKTMYYAVYHFGPRWEPVVETVLESQDVGSGQVVMQEVAVQRMARRDPPPPTAEEIDQLQAYVSEENPRPEAIRQFDRAQLRQRHPRGGNRSGRRQTPRDTPQRHHHRDAGRPAPQMQSPQRMESQRAEASQPSRAPMTMQHRGGAVAEAGDTQQIIERVRQHIEAQTGEPRPARYTVEPDRGGYRVGVQFVQEDDQGQVVAEIGTPSTARVSRRGEIVEFINGT